MSVHPQVQAVLERVARSPLPAYYTVPAHAARVAVDPARDMRRDGVIGRQRRARDALEQSLNLRMDAHHEIIGAPR